MYETDLHYFCFLLFFVQSVGAFRDTNEPLGKGRCLNHWTAIVPKRPLVAKTN